MIMSAHTVQKYVILETRVIFIVSTAGLHD